MLFGGCAKMWKAWVPNSLSLGNLCFGFISILLSSEFPYHHQQDSVLSICSMLILLAFLFDGFDGFTARLLNVESPLGEHLDTLADLTTFGIAPSVLVYQIYLRDLRLEVVAPLSPLPLGVLIAGVYPLCVAYRLARFTLNHDKKSFIGLPSPISAALVIFTLVLFEPRLSVGISTAIFLTLSFLMVSNIRYAKPQIILQENFNLIRLSVFILIILSAMFLFGWYMVVLWILILYAFLGLLTLAFHSIQKIRV